MSGFSPDAAKSKTASKRRTNIIRKTLRKFMSTSRDPAMVLDRDYTIIDANQALFDRLGLSAGEVLGRKCHEVSHQSADPCREPLHECPVRNVLKNRSSAHALHEHRSGLSGSRFYDVVAYPVGENERREVEMVLEIWHDISSTLEREIEKKEVKIKQDLAGLVHEDKMISLGKLVASAVHEINNPLSSIHTFCKVMLKMLRASGGSPTPGDVEEMERYLELMANESRRCGEIVSNLVSFSRHMETRLRHVDLNNVISKIMLLLNNKLRLQNVGPSMELDPDLPLICGDLNQIQQVLMNLIFNAMEAMPGGGKLGVSTRLDGAAGRIIVEISDTGAGIPPEYRSRVFEPFFSTKTDGAGVGLGLAVVYGIIKEHGAEIDFKSEPGRGTSFTVSFPVAPAPEIRP